MAATYKAGDKVTVTIPHPWNKEEHTIITPILLEPGVKDFFKNLFAKDTDRKAPAYRYLCKCCYGMHYFTEREITRSRKKEPLPHPVDTGHAR